MIPATTHYPPGKHLLMNYRESLHCTDVETVSYFSSHSVTRGIPTIFQLVQVCQKNIKGEDFNKAKPTLHGQKNSIHLVFRMLASEKNLMPTTSGD